MKAVLLSSVSSGTPAQTWVHSLVIESVQETTVYTAIADKLENAEYRHVCTLLGPLLQVPLKPVNM